MNKTIFTKGFTLIELLVVVLIIGILAAIALPQYQKAVIKSRLTKWTTVVDAFKKNIELKLLASGYQNISFGGTDGQDNCDIAVPCDELGSGYCEINSPFANISAGCGLAVNDHRACSIDVLSNQSDFPGTEGNIAITFVKDIDTGKWYVSSGKYMNKILCQWVQGFGYSGDSTMVSQCAAFSVTIPRYNG